VSRGIFDLSLYRIRKIRGCSGGYGNCSHGNQGIVQVILQQAVMILKIFYCARSPGRLISSFSLTEILPMNVCLGDLVRKDERFEVYAGEPD